MRLHPPKRLTPNVSKTKKAKGTGAVVDAAMTDEAADSPAAEVRVAEAAHGMIVADRVPKVVVVTGVVIVAGATAEVIGAMALIVISGIVRVKIFRLSVFPQ